MNELGIFPVYLSKHLNISHPFPLPWLKNMGLRHFQVLVVFILRPVSSLFIYIRILLIKTFFIYSISRRYNND